MTFTKDGAVIKGEKTRNVELQARREGNLYHVGEGAEEFCAASGAKMASLGLWRQRLGHLNARDLI